MRPLFLSLVLTLGSASAKPDDAMQTLVRVRSRQLSVCYALASTDVTRKGQLAVEIQPGGEVSAVTVDESLPSQVAGCVERQIRTWKFPAFIGEPRHLKWLLIIVGGVGGAQ